MSPSIVKPLPSRPPGTRSAPAGTKPKPRQQNGAESAPDNAKDVLAKRHGDGPETDAAAPSARPKSNIGVAGLLEAAQEEADYVAIVTDSAAPNLARALAHMLELQRLCDADGSAEEELAAAYAAAGIKVTKRTLNGFTPLVKLVFGRELPRTDVSRYANVLWLAYKRNVKHEEEELEQFLGAAGGVAACAETAAAERRAGAQGTSELPIEKTLRARRKAATPIKLPALDFLPEADRMTVLLERAEDGRFLILGACPATPGSVRRHLPARRA